MSDLETILTSSVYTRDSSSGVLTPNERQARIRVKNNVGLQFILKQANGADEVFDFGSQTIEDYVAGSSKQAVAGDMNLGAVAGSEDGGNPKFLASVMGNVLGDGLTKDANYLGGVIGHYSITGAKATTYPAGAVLAGIGDGVTQCDGAVVAYIDGDSGITNAGAAFKVRNNNSTPGSGFNFGVDLFDAAHDGYLAVAYLTADIRLEKANAIKSGSVDPSAGGGVDLPQGSIFLRINGAIGSTVYYKRGAAATDWTAVA
jgi:hypothetical protein